jgi:NAD(P)-dependent dehydrogenase (short-subunit alcohol dehydrogenase family)
MANGGMGVLMSTVLVTGANRGIGLGLVRHYAAAGWSVLATCRAPETARQLQALARERPGRVEILSLSVTEPGEVEDLGRTLNDRPLDLLVNNAGVRGKGASTLGSINPWSFLHAMEVNPLGALKVTEALLPNLRRAAEPLVVMMSSSLGSLTRNEEGGDYAYRASKAAMNAVMRSLAADLKKDRIAVISIHPGWVRTDMGGDHARLSVEESVSAMGRVLDGVSFADTGRFLRWDGREEPW